MIFLAFRNLFQNKTRMMISTGGVSLALLLIFTLDAIFSGVERQITAYIRNSQADIFVSQEGVRNLHMAYSSIPITAEQAVRKVGGIQSVTPILYLTNVLSAKGERSVAYVIGLPANPQAGGPWIISSGTDKIGTDEAVIDRIIAEKMSIGLGDPVEILGRNFTVVGLSEGTNSLVNSIAFISIDDFRLMNNSQDSDSFLLVKTSVGEDPAIVAHDIETKVAGVTAQTRQIFADQENRVVKDMSTDVVNIMNLIGFLIGLAVLALSIYTAVLSRRKEYGMLKALGAKNLNLYQSVISQAVISVVLGGAIGFSLTILLASLLPLIGINLQLVVTLKSFLKVAEFSVIIAILSAILPVMQIAGLNPAAVFRGR